MNMTRGWLSIALAWGFGGLIGTLTGVGMWTGVGGGGEVKGEGAVLEGGRDFERSQCADESAKGARKGD